MKNTALFDFDGVLIKTELQTFKLYQKILKEKGIILQDDDFKYKAGRKSANFWNDVLTPEQQKEINTSELTDLKRKSFTENPEQFVEKMEGVEDLLKNLKEAGFKIGLTSQNEKAMIDSTLDWLGIKEFFDTIYSIEDTKELKPNPEIYEKAMQALGSSADESLVFEDSKDGVGAAKSAGIYCIGVNHDYTIAGTLDKADKIITNFSEITVDELKNL